jgi:hypothetical protein
MNAAPEGHPSSVAQAFRPAGVKEFSLVVIAAAAMTVALTYPTAFELGHVGRVDKGDGQLSIWNVAWVARTLVVDPLHVFDANIFYPHRGTLAYSENNIGAGALAVPVYWATRNPYAAHNFVMLLAFVLSATGMYYLVRYLTHDRRAAAVSAIGFAFCPYVFGHTANMIVCPPWSAGIALYGADDRRYSESPGEAVRGRRSAARWRLKRSVAATTAYSSRSWWVRHPRAGREPPAVVGPIVLDRDSQRCGSLGAAGAAGVSAAHHGAAGRVPS